MHNSDIKQNKNNSILRLALIVVLILILGVLFYNTWVTHYNVILRFPYVMKGNIFLMLVYMILIYIFMFIYDCNNISENRIVNLIFSETLASVSCNILVYFVIIIPAAALGLMPIMPIIWLCLYDFIVIVIWSFAVTFIFKKMFPPKVILLISNKDSIDETISKFDKRTDIYHINEKILVDNNLDEVFSKCDKYDDILIGDITSEVRNDIIKHCFNNSRNIFVIPKLSDIILKYSDDIFVFDTPLYLSASFGLSLESEIFKRIFDIVVSVIVLVALLPLWLIIALLIKLEDGGPVFFIQERVTKDNVIFGIIKYRSMKVTDESLVIPTTNDDDRITKVGAILRKLHLDEIPQFINVLKGEMSVVGPRPERKEHVELYTKSIKEFEYRLKVKAGITGLAQIYGKYNTSAIDKLKLDLIYIKKYSFMLDIELMFRTLKVFIMKDNTEGFDNKTVDYIKVNASKKC